MAAALAAAALYGAPPLAGAAFARRLRPAAAPRLLALDVLVPLGLVVQLAPHRHGAALAAGYLVLAAWVAARLRAATSGPERAAFALLAGGGLLNGAAMAANGRMPYAGHATGDPGLKGVAIDAHTHLVALADWIPVLGKLVSPGDVLLAAGVALLVAGVLARRPEADAGPRAATS